MNFFSGSQPNLVNNKTMKAINLSVLKNSEKVPSLNTSMGNFYNNYIESNLFFVITFVIFCMFLIYKYMAKQNTQDTHDKSEGFTEKEIYYSDNIKRATFNASIPVNEQTSYTNYIDDTVPMAGNAIMRPVNNPEITYQPITYPANDRIYYTGTDNTYENALDSDMPHPFNWALDQNKTTGTAVKFMTSRNKSDIDESEKPQYHLEVPYTENINF